SAECSVDIANSEFNSNGFGVGKSMQTIIDEEKHEFPWLDDEEGLADAGQTPPTEFFDHESMSEFICDPKDKETAIRDIKPFIPAGSTDTATERKCRKK